MGAAIPESPSTTPGGSSSGSSGGRRCPAGGEDGHDGGGGRIDEGPSLTPTGGPPSPPRNGRPCRAVVGHLVGLTATEQGRGI